MRPAVLYTLKQTEIPVSDYSEFVRVSKTSSYLMRPLTLDSGTVTDREFIEELKIPVHHIKRCLGPQEKLLENSRTYNNRNIQDYFIAMEPALAEIMEAPFKHKIMALDADVSNLQNKLRKAQEDLRVTGASLKELELRVSKFNKKPLWKRLFRAFRGITVN